MPARPAPAPPARPEEGEQVSEQEEEEESPRSSALLQPRQLHASIMEEMRSKGVLRALSAVQ